MPKELLMSSSTYDQGEDFTYDQGHTVASRKTMSEDATPTVGKIADQLESEAAPPVATTRPPQSTPSSDGRRNRCIGARPYFNRLQAITNLNNVGLFEWRDINGMRANLKRARKPVTQVQPHPGISGEAKRALGDTGTPSLYRDKLADPGLLIGDSSHIYRGMDDTIVHNHPENPTFGTSPATAGTPGGHDTMQRRPHG